jgi:hypothetical protein
LRGGFIFDFAVSSEAKTVSAYIASLPDTHKKAIKKLRKTLQENLPPGFAEGLGYGMICYSVPHSRYPAGYHVNPDLPLPFISIASQKNFIAFYHMGMYGDVRLLKWFKIEYPRHSDARLDMGKSCVRFRKPENIPYQLLGDLASRITVDQWISRYENVLKSKK